MSAQPHNATVVIPTRVLSPNRAARRVLAALAVLLLLSAAGGSSAGPIFFGKAETPRNYSQVAGHGPLVGPVDLHVLPGLPNQFWNSPVTLRGTTGGVADRITAVHCARHRVPVCPGEVAPAPWWLAPPISPPPLPIGRSFAGATGRVLHPGPWNHFDYYIEVLSAMYWGPMPFRIRSYAYASAGVHDPEVCAGRGGELGSEQMIPPPPVPSSNYGVAVVAYDGGTSTFSLAATVIGIPRQEILAAFLHVGGPGQVGPAVFPLGPGPEWMELGSEAVGRVITNAVLPPEFAQALLEGYTYVQIYTVQRPDGELRGQLQVMPEVAVRPGDMNCDGAVNFDDIDPFVLALSGEEAYAVMFPECQWLAADCNLDGAVNFDDIDPFVAQIGQ